MRIAKVPIGLRKEDSDLPSIISLGSTLILEDQYRSSIDSFEKIEKLMVPTQRRPTVSEYQDLLDAWAVVTEIRSNGVVLWKEGTSLGIGTGQTDRVGAVEDAIGKAERYNHDLQGGVMASDGFIPNVDNIEAIAKKGIKAVIQPGGSAADKSVIAKCDENGIAMVFTAERAFSHF